MNAVGRLAILLVCAALLAGTAQAQLIFSDNFNTTASASWGNEVGNWSATSGVYNAASPNNSPATYSSLPYALTDFSVTVTINALSDGGIWLRSANNQNGILLVTGGYGLSGRGLYWHEIQGGAVSGPLQDSGVLFATNPVGSATTITVTVVGNTYSAYVNGSSTAATTLTSTLFASGKVALYDYSGQTFDDFSLTVIPEPSGIAALAGGLAVLVGWRFRRARGGAAA